MEKHVSQKKFQWPNSCIKAFITLKGQFVFLEKASSYFLSLSFSNPKETKIDKQLPFGTKSAILYSYNLYKKCSKVA